ncbi:MAG: GGDEF domain-containing protein [Clostridia bacterium]|nr:GGDEF domain-containing protein [Clostridia bacterium]
MDGISIVKSLPGRAAERAATMIRNNSSVLDECAQINIKRIFYMSLIVIPSRILHLLFFTTSNDMPEIWFRGIIASHTSLLIFWSMVFLVALILKNKKQPNTAIHALQYIVPIVTMASGVIIAALDQLITTNITPFLLTSIVVGGIFLIRPLVSALIYITSYDGFHYSIALTITSPEVLLSNRVNGTTAVALGFLISAVAWHYNYTNITQSRHIEIQQKQLEQLAYYDPLTNLCNRNFFNRILEKELSLVQRYGNESAIIIFDIDDFKDVNDTLGHLAGDQMLLEVAQLIEDNIRTSDTVSRFGGDEFVILAPKSTMEEGSALAEKLRRLISERIFILNSTPIHVTASFGVSTIDPGKNLGLDDYLTLADDALYLAKKRGENRVEKL